MDGRLPDPLVTTGWLAAHLGEPDLKVVDATFYLPHLGRDARARAQIATHRARLDDVSAAPPPTSPRLVPPSSIASATGAPATSPGT